MSPSSSKVVGHHHHVHVHKKPTTTEKESTSHGGHRSHHILRPLIQHPRGGSGRPGHPIGLSAGDYKRDRAKIESDSLDSGDSRSGIIESVTVENGKGKGDLHVTTKVPVPSPPPDDSDDAEDSTEDYSDEGEYRTTTKRPCLNNTTTEVPPKPTTKTPKPRPKPRPIPPKINPIKITLEQAQTPKTTPMPSSKPTLAHVTKLPGSLTISSSSKNETVVAATSVISTTRKMHRITIKPLTKNSNNSNNV